MFPCPLLGNYLFCINLKFDADRDYIKINNIERDSLRTQIVGIERWKSVRSWREMKNSGSALLIITVYRKKSEKWYFLLKKLVFQRWIYQLTPTSELRLPRRRRSSSVARRNVISHTFFDKRKSCFVYMLAWAEWQGSRPVICRGKTHCRFESDRQLHFRKKLKNFWKSLDKSQKECYIIIQSNNGTWKTVTYKVSTKGDIPNGKGSRWYGNRLAP